MVFTRADLGFGDVPTQLDQPDHVPVRRLIQPLLSSSAVTALEPIIRRLARELLEPLRDARGCEFNSQFALPLAGGTINHAMGVPGDIGDELLQLALDVAHPDRVEGGRLDAHRRSVDRIASIWNELIVKRRAQPQEDWISYLASSKLNGEPLDDALVARLADTLFRAGFDTTAGTLAYAFHHLAGHPEDRRLLSAQNLSISPAIEETLRCFGADVLISRTAAGDLDFHGIQLAGGDRIVLLLAAANQDPGRFESPHDFLLARDPNPHLAFGVGPHRCVGLLLARAELGIALEEWHARIPDYRLVTNEPLRHEISETARLSRLELEFVS